MFLTTKISAAVVLATVASTCAFAQNNKPVRSGTYYEDRASTGYVYGNPQLTLMFAQTPADKFFNISRVSCMVYMYNNQLLMSAKLIIGTASGGADTGRDYYIPDIGGGTVLGQGRFYNFGAPITFKVGAGRYPSINFYAPLESNTSLLIQANCIIVGDLSDT